MTTSARPAATPSTAVACIAPALNQSLRYGQLLAPDIPAERFAHQPHPNMNHPAFCYGHLSLYGDRILHLLGRGDATDDRPAYRELFAAGVECIADDDRYPAKDEILAYYTRRYEAALAALREANDDVLDGPNPVEGRFREWFPTVGAAVTFVAGPHHMMHLGQVSAWRRAVGLPGVM